MKNFVYKYKIMYKNLRAFSLFSLLFLLPIVSCKICAMNGKTDSKSKMISFFSGEDREVMVTTSKDRKILIWDISSLKNLSEKNFKKLVVLKPVSEISKEKFIDNINNLWCFSKLAFNELDRDILFSGSASGSVDAWDLRDIKNPRFISNVFNSKKFNSIYSLMFNKFNKRIIAIGSDDNVKIFDTSDIKKLRNIAVLKGDYLGLFDPFNKGRFISCKSCGRNKGLVAIWDMRDLKEIKKISDIEFNLKDIIKLEFSPLKENLLAIADITKVYFVDISDEQKPKVVAEIKRAGGIKSMAFSPNDKNRFIMATDSSDSGSMVEIFDLSVISYKNTPKCLMTIIDENDFFTSVAFSPYNKNIIFLGESRGLIRAFDISQIGSPKRIAKLNGHADKIDSIIFLPKLKKIEKEEKELKDKLLKATELKNEIRKNKPATTDVRIHFKD